MKSSVPVVIVSCVLSALISIAASYCYFQYERREAKARQNKAMAAATEAAMAAPPKTQANSGSEKSFVLYEMKPKGEAGGKCPKISTRKFNFINAGLKEALLNVDDKTGAFVLARGAYLCRIHAPAAFDGSHQLVLQDISSENESKTLLLGTSESTSASTPSRSHIVGQFTLEKQSALAVFHFCKGEKAGISDLDLGKPTGQYPEIYAALECSYAALSEPRAATPPSAGVEAAKANK